MSQLAIDGGPPVRREMLLFGSPAIGDDEITEVIDTLKSGWIGTGPKVEQFEREFASYVGAGHAIALNSCTGGLHLSLLTAGIGEGDEVIVPSLTFAATANVVEHVRARPVIVDIDSSTLCIDPEQLERAITERTKAVIPVHFGGMPCPMNEILRVAHRHDLLVIEDAAHAVGAKYDGKPVGSISPITAFSFYATKNLTTAEGGMLTTDSDELQHMLRIYRLHGLRRDAWRRYHSRRFIPPEVVLPGYKYNMTDVQASLGIHQLRKQESFLERRHAIATQYDNSFKELLHLVQLGPRPDSNCRHSFHLYVLLLKLDQLKVNRDQIVNALLAENIGATMHFLPLHIQPFYRDRYGYKPDDLPVARRVGESILSLPLVPQMTDGDVRDVVAAVYKVLSAYDKGG